VKFGDNGENEINCSVSISNAEPERKMREPGIVISWIAVKPNTDFPIRLSLESGSNMMIYKPLQSATESNDEQPPHILNV
jgi:hypothetical protein